jgi:hypothetical protein
MSINTIMLEAYKDYIEYNLDRIARDGWTPVCFEEFKASAESEHVTDTTTGESQ